MTRKAAFEPQADNFLKALSGAIQDKNATIRKSWATAVGYVCQLTSQQKTIAFLKHIRKIYVEEDGRWTSISTIQSCVALMNFPLLYR